MKAKIHPKYHSKANVKCNCGETFEVGSTLEEIKVEVCAACHPFYTGKTNLIDSAGRVDKFEARRKAAAERAAAKAKKTEAKPKADSKDKNNKEALKEMKKAIK